MNKDVNISIDKIVNTTLNMIVPNDTFEDPQTSR